MSSISLIKDFQTLGCNNVLKCAIASRVYLHLNEIIKVENMEQLYDSGLDLLYFRVQPQCFDSEIVIPMSSCTEVDMLQMEEIQRKLSGDMKSITLAICDPSSTILYYSAVNNFVEKEQSTV